MGESEGQLGRWSQNFRGEREELLADKWDGEYWRAFFHTEDVLTAPIIDTGQLNFDPQARDGDDTGLVAQYAGEEWGGWASSLTPDQKWALNDYTTEYYQAINSYLRTGKAVTDLPYHPEFFPERDVSEFVRNIDSALTARTSNPMVLYRGGGGSRLASLSEGNVFVDDAYTSTTLNREYAMNFTDRSRSGTKVLTRVHVPAGQQMGYTGYYKETASASTESVGSHGGEWEIILPRRTSFRVVDSRMEGDLHIIDVEVVP